MTDREQVVDENEISKNNYYDWPTDEPGKSIGEIWRFLTLYSVVDDEGRPFALLQNNHGKRLILIGALAPRPDYVFRDFVNIRLEVARISIHYGTSPRDHSQGLWIESSQGVWYKLEEPSDDFAQCDEIMKTYSTKLLQVYFCHKLFPLNITLFADLCCPTTRG